MTSAFGTRNRTQHATILPSFEQQEQHHELHTRAVDAERERDDLQERAAHQHARHLAVERQCHELHARAIDAERRCERGLARTERCVSGGGMVVEATGKLRTKGGIFVKLLKEATDLDLEQQARAIECVKRDGLAAKKARVQQAVKRAKRKAEVASRETHARRPPPRGYHGGSDRVRRRCPC